MDEASPAAALTAAPAAALTAAPAAAPAVAPVATLVAAAANEVEVEVAGRSRSRSRSRSHSRSRSRSLEMDRERGVGDYHNRRGPPRGPHGGPWFGRGPHPLDGTLPEDHFNNFPEEDFQTEADGVVPVALDEGLWAQAMAPLVRAMAPWVQDEDPRARPWPYGSRTRASRWPGKRALRTWTESRRPRKEPSSPSSPSQKVS